MKNIFMKWAANFLMGKNTTKDIYDSLIITCKYIYVDQFNKNKHRTLFDIFKNQGLDIFITTFKEKRKKYHTNSWLGRFRKDIENDVIDEIRAKVNNAGNSDYFDKNKILYDELTGIKLVERIETELKFLV